MPDGAAAVAPAPAAGITPAGQTPPGPTGPQTVAPKSDGMRMRGMVLVSIALNALDQAAGLIGSGSEEGQELMRALVQLRKKFGGARRDLGQQEVKMLGESGVSPVQAPTPQQGQAWQQMVKSKMAGLGMGAPAAPQGG